MINNDPLLGDIGKNLNADTAGNVFEIKQQNEVFAPRRDLFNIGPSVVATIAAMFSTIPIYTEETDVKDEKYDIHKAYHVYLGKKYYCDKVKQVLIAVHNLITKCMSSDADMSFADALVDVGWEKLSVDERELVLSFTGRCFITCYFANIMVGTSNAALINPSVLSKFSDEIAKYTAKFIEKDDGDASQDAQ